MMEDAYGAAKNVMESSIAETTVMRKTAPSNVLKINSNVKIRTYVLTSEYRNV